jgi:hypothetical protein
MPEKLVRDRLKQGAKSLGEFANDFGEMHALGAGFLSTAVVLDDLPPLVYALTFLGVLAAYEDVVGEGHYFLIGLSLGVLVFA